MIKNYFKIAWRNLKRNKAYAIISVTGLALGIACAILIFTLISYHLSFDNFHKNPDRIFKMYTEWHDDGIGRSAGTPQPLAKAFRENFTLGEKTARTIGFRNNLITITGKEVKKFREENGVAFTEPEYFDILNFPLVKGNTKNLLSHPNEALITEKMAKKYFGDEDAIGKVFRLDNKVNFKVTGILKDFPANTDLKYELLVSYANMDEYTDKGRENNWGGVYSSCEAFTLLKPGVTMKQAEAALATLVKQHFEGREAKVWHFKLQPLNDIHFNPELGGYTDKKYLWALFFIGLFLIVTACVNFVNLATAQALNRSKEVGIRKVLGSMPRQLFWQFIAETALITLVSVVLAIGVAQIGLPALNNLFQSRMSFNWLVLCSFIVIITIVVVFLSGSYPGLVLARFQPIEAIKSKLSQKHVGGFSLRRVLVVVQFAISQVLIIGTIIVIAQLKYSQNTNLGFDKDGTVIVPVPFGVDKIKQATLSTRIKELPAVKSLSFCYRPPASNSNNSTGLQYDNRAEDEHWSVNMKYADANYLSTFKLQLVAGRNFFPADTVREFVVNETFAKKLNLKPQDLIGKMVAANGRSVKGVIVGVVKDFYNLSFHSEISPILMMPDVQQYANIGIKIDMRNAAATMASIEKVWSESFPDELYSYQFMEDNIAKFYEMDKITSTLIQGFALIAIFIGCLGLYGLVSFMAVRKTKEIGVRKVLGAGIFNVLWLFGKEFSRLLIIAFLIAAPLAWWAMHNYLKDFEYRITIGPEIFVMAIIATFIIAAVTVGYRASVAALTNPVKSLRSE